MANTIYDIDFTKQAPQLLPPDKRFTRNIAFAKILLYPLQYLRDLWFGSYRTGSTATLWTVSTPYAKYTQVKYNKIVYESLKAANTDNPTVVASWRVVQPNFIGVFERVQYNGQKLVLEYAMNTWFGTTFRQPSSVSDIYISNNAMPVPFFRSTNADLSSSSVNLATSSEYVINGYSFATVKNFTIYCPVAVYNALDGTLINNDKIFRAFVDRYVPAGITYQIVTY